MKQPKSSTYIRRFRNAALAFLFMATQFVFPLAASGIATAAEPLKITGKTHQGQEAPTDTYTSGHITTYKEGESINFRFDLESTGSTSGQIQVRFTGDDSTCLFFDGTFSLGTHDATAPAIEPVSGALPTVSTVGSPVATDFGTSSGEWVQTLNVSFSGSGEARINYWVTLSDEAGECNGASQHSRLSPAGGSVEQTGQQNVPVPANQINELPDITVTKMVDTTGDGVADRTALAGEWAFSLDGAAPIITNANGQVTYTNVTPDGPHTVTESGGPVSQSFVNGTGTNCTFNGAIATATVLSGTTAQDASCTFTNGIRTGSITISKNAIPDSAQDFAFTTTGTGLSNFSLDNDTDGTLPHTRTFSGLLPGTYSVTESAVNGWDFDNVSCPGVSVIKNGTTITITLAAGQNVSCEYTNRQRGNIIVQKVTYPANDTTAFSVTATGSGSINGTATRSITTSQNVIYDVAHGTYNITENLTSTPGWAETSNNCSNLTISGNTPLVNGIPTLSCTITNTKLAKLKIVKDAVPNSGQDFGFTTTGTGLSPFNLDDDADATLSNEQQFVNLMPGSYSVTEGSVLDQQGKPLWDLTGLTCSGTTDFTQNSSTLNVTLIAGDDVTCTFTNTQRGSISGTKYEANADGSTVGSSGLGGWTINLLLNGNLVSTTTTASNGDYSFNNLAPGSEYTVEEVLQNGWTQIYDPLGITLSAGENETDQDFGNFQNGTISGYKWNDLNGNGVDNSEPRLSGWTIYIDADNSGTLNTGDPSTITDAQGAYSFSNLAPNIAPGTQYKVCEVQQAGWVQTYPANDSCHTAIINISGETETRNFGNQGRGTIQVVKNVDTDGDGDIDVSGATDWTWDINSSGNYTTGSSQNVPAGTYTVSEDQKANYHVTYSSCTNEPNGIVNTSLSVTVTPGENVICTFTNTRDTGTITVIKRVVTDNGSTAVPANFNMHVTTNSVDITGSPVAGSTQGTTFTVPTGTYEVHEIATAGIDLTDYLTTISCDWNNTRGGSAEGVTSQPDIYVAANDVVTCIFTNNDIAPQLTVIKQVINDNSGSSAPADFTMQVTGTNVAPSANFPGNSNGTTVTLNAGVYSLGESGPAGYTASYSADCAGTIALAETKTCTIINNDVPHPGIHVEKSGPATAHEGDIVTYTFTVTNTGDTVLNGTAVSDTIAGNGTYQSGDTNNDGKLDRTETWIFTKSYTVPTPQVANVVNTATACATDPAGTQVCDDDGHELDVLHPAISVIKYGPELAYEGQTVGYTFLVTNEGDTTLYNVSISDDIAGSESCVKLTLAPQESTTCSAIYLIPIPTLNDVTNTVIASGTDTLGQTVTDIDDHTLDVLHPGIHIAKSGPATAHEGDIVTYTFLVSNIGDIALSGVSVNDNVAGLATYQSGDTNDNDLLDLTEIWTFTVNYTIPTPQVANIINTATACGDDPQRNEYCDNDSHELDVLHPSITVVKSGQATAYEGETVNYSFVVTNTGDVVLSNVGISDDIAVNELCPKTTLQPLESMTCIADYAIPTPQTADVINNVTTSGTDTLGQTVTGTDDHILDVLHPTITVVKQVVSTTKDSGLFNLQIDGISQATNVGDEGTTGSKVVTPGAHTIGETAGTDTDLSDYAVTYSENCANGSVTVVRDEHQTCTITNTHLATLTIVKDATPFSEQDFKFTVEKANHEQDNTNARLALLETIEELEGQATSFLLDDDTDPTLSDKETLTQLALGTYYITEDAVKGWDLTDIDCGKGVEFDQDGSTIAVTLEAGVHITCTFTNTQRSKVTIIKDAQPNTNQEFKFTARIDSEETHGFVLTDNGTEPELASQAFSNLVPGTYVFTEAPVNGWTLSSISCGEGLKDGIATYSANGVTLDLKPGAHMICYFVNTQDTGTITINKKLTPTTDPGKFNLFINNWAYAINIGNDGTTGAITLPTGTYTVSESAYLGTLIEGYESSYTCTDGTSVIKTGNGVSAGQIKLSKNQNIVCTFANNKGEVLSVATPTPVQPQPALVNTGFGVAWTILAGVSFIAAVGTLAFATRRYDR